MRDGTSREMSDHLGTTKEAECPPSPEADVFDAELDDLGLGWHEGFEGFDDLEELFEVRLRKH